MCLICCMKQAMIIGVVGPKGAGKDTIADYLVANHGFTKLAFADPVKKVCEVMFALDPVYFHCPRLKEEVVTAWGYSPRQMMQIVGTDMVRSQMGDKFWIQHFQVRLQALGPDAKVVVSDVRFANEADFIQSLPDSFLLRVTNGSVGTDPHVSETEQCSIRANYVIHNDMNEGGLNKLYKECDDVIVSRTKSV